MKAKLFLTYALALCLMVSCKKDDAEKNLDTDILVAAKIDEGNVVVMAESEKAFPCYNYKITYSLLKSGNGYIIKFTEIPEPTICLDAPGRAKAKITIGRLSSGTYPLIFQLNSIQTGATLVVDTAATILISQPGNVKLN